MNNHFIQLTHFVSKKPFHINVNKIVTVEPEEGEGNARITTCLNLSYYTVETVSEVMDLVQGKVVFGNPGIELKISKGQLTEVLKRSEKSRS